MALRGKMQAYAEARAQGLRPLDAGAIAGYSGAGVKVTISRMEKRDDVKAEIKRLKRGGKPEQRGEEKGTLDKWQMRDRYLNPLELMLDLMNNPEAPKSLRYQAAKDALPYCHPRKEGGKKDEAKERATKASQGKFQPSARPSHLHAVK